MTPDFMPLKKDNLDLDQRPISFSRGGEGVPFVFDSFDVQGKVDSLDELIGGKRWKPYPATEIRKREVPVENTVVQFPGRPTWKYLLISM
jgi:hypothetical protein